MCGPAPSLNRRGGRIVGNDARRGDCPVGVCIRPVSWVKDAPGPPFETAVPLDIHFAGLRAMRLPMWDERSDQWMVLIP